MKVEDIKNPMYNYLTNWAKSHTGKKSIVLDDPCVLTSKGYSFGFAVLVSEDGEVAMPRVHGVIG